MRYFILGFSFLVLACGNDLSNRSADCLKGEDSIYFDSMMAAIRHRDDPRWEVFDSVGVDKFELWRLEGAENTYEVELRYNAFQRNARVLLTDNLPSYLYDTHDDRFLFTDLNGMHAEAVIRLGGTYGGATPDFAREEQQEFIYIVDLDSAKVIWKGCYVSKYFQRSNVPDSLHGEYEVGYDYKVHVTNGEILIDSLRILGDSVDSQPDHQPGRYQWKNGTFVLIPE